MTIAGYLNSTSSDLFPAAYCKIRTYFKEEEKAPLLLSSSAVFTESFKSQPWLLNSYSLFFPNLSQVITGSQELNIFLSKAA